MINNSNSNSNFMNELLSSDINNIVEYVNNISNDKTLSNEIVDMRNNLMGKPKRKPRATKAKPQDNSEPTIVNELVALARDETNDIENVVINSIVNDVQDTVTIDNKKEEQKRLKEEQKKEKEEQKRLKEEQKKEKEEQKRLKEEQKKEKEEQKRLKDEQKKEKEEQKHLEEEEQNEK